MSFLGKITKMFGNSQGTAVTSSARSVAKERLSVILASQRGSELLDGVDMEALQRDVLKVVQKHISVAKNESMQMNLNSVGEVSLFEMSVELEGQASRPVNLRKAA